MECRRDIALSRAHLAKYAMRGSTPPHPTQPNCPITKEAPPSTVIVSKPGIFEVPSRHRVFEVPIRRNTYCEGGLPFNLHSSSEAGSSVPPPSGQNGLSSQWPVEEAVGRSSGECAHVLAIARHESDDYRTFIESKEDFKFGVVFNFVERNPNFTSALKVPLKKLSGLANLNFSLHQP